MRIIVLLTICILSGNLFPGGKDIYGNDLSQETKIGYVDGSLTMLKDYKPYVSPQRIGELSNDVGYVTHDDVRNIVEDQFEGGIRNVAIANVCTEIPEILTNRVSYTNQKTYEGETRSEDENGSVVIGKNAIGTIDEEYISSLTNQTGNVNLRSEAVVIGHNACAKGTSDKTVQAIAIGWNAKSIGSSSIAIGSGAVHWYEDDITGPATIAEGGQSIAIGYNAKVKAKSAVQIGNGKNDTDNSLKFQDVFVVKDGRVQGGVDKNEIEKIVEMRVSPKVVEDEGIDSITVRSFSMNTYDPTNCAMEEVEINSTSTRNYEIFLPNVHNLRSSLPIMFDIDIEGNVTKLGSWWTNKILRLPAKVSVKEPVEKTLILDVVEYDTNFDWSPVVTRAYEWNGSWLKIEGTNLHFCVQAEIGDVVRQIRNPLYGVVSVDVTAVSGESGILRFRNGSTVHFTVE